MLLRINDLEYFNVQMSSKLYSKKMSLNSNKIKQINPNNEIFLKNIYFILEISY